MPILCLVSSALWQTTGPSWRMKRAHPVTWWKHLVAPVTCRWVIEQAIKFFRIDLTFEKSRSKKGSSCGGGSVLNCLAGRRGRPRVGSGLGTLSPCIKLLVSPHFIFVPFEQGRLVDGIEDKSGVGCALIIIE